MKQSTNLGGAKSKEAGARMWEEDPGAKGNKDSEE
jgi:hypothetical protein